MRGRLTQTYYREAFDQEHFKWIKEKHAYKVIPNKKIKMDEFKRIVIEILQSNHPWKSSQGHFYFPDFRFILGKRLGFKLKEVDDMLGYAIYKDVDFRARLWFPVLFGIKNKRDLPSEQLMSVLSEPFDSICLNR